MSVLSGSVAPKPTEPLGRYIQRVREELSLTQAELSQKAGVHVQTIRKIESGNTSRLNQKAKSGLAAALRLVEAVEVLLDADYEDTDVRDEAYKRVSQEQLIKAVTHVKLLARPDGDDLLDTILSRWRYVRIFYLLF